MASMADWLLPGVLGVTENPCAPCQAAPTSALQAFCDGRPWPASRLPRVQQAGSDLAALAQLLQSHPAAAPEDTLRCQLKRAQTLCSNAFSGSPRAISPQILPICTMQVAPQVSPALWTCAEPLYWPSRLGLAKDSTRRGVDALGCGVRSELLSPDAVLTAVALTVCLPGSSRLRISDCLPLQYSSRLSYSTFWWCLQHLLQPLWP